MKKQKIPFEGGQFPLAVLVNDFAMDAHQHGVNGGGQRVIIHL